MIHPLFRATAILATSIVALANTPQTTLAAVVDFEDLTVFTGTSGNTGGQPGGQFYNGDSGIGTNSNGWSSGGTFFSNTFDSSFGGFWSGWAYSTVVNPITSGFGNQYASAPGGGSAGGGAVAAGGTYAIGFGGPNFINLPTGMRATSIDVANTTYARLSMQNGDSFAKKFGGPSGTDPDFFRLELSGFSSLDGQGSSTGVVTVDLADFTSSDNAQDFILSTWATVDLTSLGDARSMSISFLSSDVGQFGINTPTYVAIDNLSLTAVPEPSGAVLILALGVASCLCRRRMR